MSQTQTLTDGRTIPSGPTKMTPSEAFVETLVSNGVTDMFGIMGSAFMDAMDIFAPAGIRKNYYVETNEDALVMWNEHIDQPSFAARLASIEAEVPGTTVRVEGLE